MSKPSRRSGPVDWHAVRARLKQADAAMAEALDPTPARAKAIMDARARALAQVLAPTRTPGSCLDLVEFALGREHYAIETRYVREVDHFTDYTPVPGTPNFVVGVTNLRGIVLAVVDLRRLFNIPQQGLTDSSRLIVLGTERIEFAILADETFGRIDLATEDMVSPPQASDIGRAFLRGVTRDSVVVIDGAALLDDPRLVINEGRKASD